MSGQGAAYKVYFDLEAPMEDITVVVHGANDAEAKAAAHAYAEDCIAKGFVKKDRDKDASNYVSEYVPLDKLVRVQISKHEEPSKVGQIR